MTLRNNIKKILKEETSKSEKVVELINKFGIINASVALGGIETISKVLDKKPESLLTKYLSKKTFSTDDIEKDTGGYNFKFRLLYVKKSERYASEHDFVFIIEKGTVDLIMVDEGEYDLLGDDVREYDGWWEIKHEIRDILFYFTKQLINKIKLDFESVSVNYLFKGREQFKSINEETEKSQKNKLEDAVKKMIDFLVKDEKFPENFYDFMIDIIEDEKYNEKILRISTVMKKPFSEEDSDNLYQMRRKFMPKIKGFFGGQFDRFSYGGTSTLEVYKRDKERDNLYPNF